MYFTYRFFFFDIIKTKVYNLNKSNKGDDMNEKELMILKLIRQNPFLSQQEMAEELNMSRPALANIISGLTRQGKIVGRAYILPEENEVICIGGANMDRKFHIKGKAQLGTSNPAAVTQSIGGVTRNIAENLGRLGHHVSLLTGAGKDSDWNAIKEASASYMNVSNVEQFQSASTGSYTAVLDEQGEMLLAVANMDVYDLLVPELLMKHEATMSNAACIVMDLNCPKETIESIKELALVRQIPFVLIPVSSPKMDRMPKDLNGVTWFICNRDEAETYLDSTITSEEDWKKAVQALLEKGAENVVITAGSKGVYAASKDLPVKSYAAIQIDHVEDVTGAGDAFVGALLHSWILQEPFAENIQNGLMNAAKTLQSAFTVRPELSANKLKNELEE